MSKSVEEATTAVKDYLKSTNRPYSANDIVNNLQSKFSKAAVTKALDALVSENEIVERPNGKQKIYFISQDNIKVDHLKLKEMDEKIEQFNARMCTLKESNSVKEQKIKALQLHISLDQYAKNLKSVCEQVVALQAKLKSVNAKCKNVDPETQLKIKNDHQKLTTEWKKRKRLASEVIGSMADSCSKPKKALIEEMGIETDESVNAVLPI